MHTYNVHTFKHCNIPRYRKIPGDKCYGGVSSQYLPSSSCSEYYRYAVTVVCIRTYCISLLYLHIAAVHPYVTVT